MQSVKVNKTDLVEKMKANRDNHCKIAEEAYKIYVQDIISALKERLKNVKDSGKVTPEDLYINLVEPQNHTSEYDVILAMLDMSTEQVVNLTHNEFNCYVMDNWGWKQTFTTSSGLYLNKRS